MSTDNNNKDDDNDDVTTRCTINVRSLAFQPNEPIMVYKKYWCRSKTKISGPGQWLKCQRTPMMIYIDDLGYRHIPNCTYFQNFLAEGDKDGDHRISKEEFTELMNKIAGAKK